MRPLLFILGICVGIVGVGNRAEAQNYPWCAIYNGGRGGGGTNCGFTSFQQCMDTREQLGRRSAAGTACPARNAPVIHRPSIGSALWLEKA